VGADGTDEHKDHVGADTRVNAGLRVYVRQSGETDEPKTLRFVGSAWPTNVSLVRRP
jgi:hypothetical protein